MLFLLARLLGESGAGFMWQQGARSVVEVLLVEANNLDVVTLRERFDEVFGRVVRPWFCVCYDTLDGACEIGVALFDVVTNFVSIVCA